VIWNRNKKRSKPKKIEKSKQMKKNFT